MIPGWTANALNVNKLALEDKEVHMAENFPFVLKETCANHVNDETCMQLAGSCTHVTSDADWIRGCCRRTCNSCFVSRSQCPLPAGGNVMIKGL